MSREAVNRGIKRGEVRPEGANGYVFDAEPAMVMHHSRMCGCEGQDREVEETIDQLMVSLLRPNDVRPGVSPAATRARPTGVSRAVPGGVI